MAESLRTALDLLTRPEFRAALLLGLLAAGLMLLRARSEKRLLDDWGTTLTVVVVIAVHLTVGRRLGVVAGLLLLSAGGWAAGRSSIPSRALGWGAVWAGAVIVAWRGGIGNRFWPLVVTPVVIILAGWGLSKWVGRLDNTTMGPMVAVAAFGIWATVPETEMARALLGAALPLGLATLRPVQARLMSLGAYPLAGVMTWISAAGGQARPASIIGGWACLGLLLIVPMSGRGAADLVKARPLAIWAIHAVVVLIASRVIGLWQAALPAAGAVAVLAMVAYLVVGFLLERHRGRVA